MSLPLFTLIFFLLIKKRSFLFFFFSFQAPRIESSSCADAEHRILKGKLLIQTRNLIILKISKIATIKCKRRLVSSALGYRLKRRPQN